MPLHLNSIANDSENTSFLAWILQKGMDECNSIFVSDDQQFILIRRDIIDSFSGDMIGGLIYTIKQNEEQKVLEVLDLDIVLKNDTPSIVRFLNLRKGSDSNEYYEIEMPDEGQHLEVETVNRHAAPKDLLNKEYGVFVSLFPFELDVFKNINEFNQWAGFSEPIEAGESGLKVHGFSEKFAMPGNMSGKYEDEYYSFLIGTVKEYRDVQVELGGFVLDFVLAMIDTAMGIVPAAMGRDVFDISSLREGCIVAMNADVKVDLAHPEDFKTVKQEDR